MSKHEQQDDKDKYSKNGAKPGAKLPPEDPGGKHGKKDDEDKGKKEK